MNLTLKLIPINNYNNSNGGGDDIKNLQNENEKNVAAKTVTILPLFNNDGDDSKKTNGGNDNNTEICLNIKCFSPFAKYKVLISVEGFDAPYVQATFCTRSDSVAIINKRNEKQIIFDGFVKSDDEGTTVPFMVGPLYSVMANQFLQNNDGSDDEDEEKKKRKVVDIVNAIESKQTMIKIFINEANVNNKWDMFKQLFISKNILDYESILVNNVVKFMNSVDKNGDVNYNSNKTTNVTKWVPVASNFVTGKRLLTVLFILKFK
ncbi:ORF-121 [Catopsilia pomona nucleopolyhedrovirus]|uniref:ORF-121 n=1 Tax=Catopsilia pomona nucleopolyhedrovirus TaxID=1850906 RepID=A0A172WZJ4_9ABAC|nr:ORF-121 [Catopsilia pomona nucleopolyhedrovirus]ANF29769.1 ORF-121 [Catopsilia pomona nucleopolyhedrovirus]